MVERDFFSPDFWPPPAKKFFLDGPGRLSFTGVVFCLVCMPFGSTLRAALQGIFPYESSTISIGYVLQPYEIQNKFFKKSSRRWMFPHMPAQRSSLCRVEQKSLTKNKKPGTKRVYKASLLRTDRLLMYQQMHLFMYYKNDTRRLIALAQCMIRSLFFRDSLSIFWGFGFLPCPGAQL